MPFVKLTRDGISIRRRRILVSGEPNMRKTTAMLTLPRPLVIMSYPGEKGYDTIPTDEPEILPLIWTADGKQGSHAIVKEVFDRTSELIAGKYGKFVSFAGDGLHKLYDYILDSITDGAYLAGEEFESKLYGPATREFNDYLSRVMHTMIPVVGFTCWAEPEADRAKKAGEESRDIPSHIYPALPGKAAKKILGEFSVVVHQRVGKLKPTDLEPQALWQTRPYGEVWGCGLKGPTEVVKRIPTFIPADYRVLEMIWERAEKEAGQSITDGAPSAAGPSES